MKQWKEPLEILDSSDEKDKKNIGAKQWLIATML
jgi:hypothetical protein